MQRKGREGRGIERAWVPVYVRALFLIDVLPLCHSALVRAHVVIPLVKGKERMRVSDFACMLSCVCACVRVRVRVCACGYADDQRHSLSLSERA